MLEEGLRGAGGHLYNGRRERFMERYDPARLERSTRDVVARSSYLEIMEGRGSPGGGVFIDVSHLGAEFVERTFPGMVKRCRDVGLDLAREPVEVTPTAHFQMGGVKIGVDCASNLEGLFVAGEDAGTVHGANRLGGNGVAESTVFGCIAGDTMAARVNQETLPSIDLSRAEEVMRVTSASLSDTADGRTIYAVRHDLQHLMWEQVGLVSGRHALGCGRRAAGRAPATGAGAPRTRRERLQSSLAGPAEPSQPSRRVRDDCQKRPRPRGKPRLTLPA